MGRLAEKPVVLWALVGGCAFLAGRFLGAGEGGSHYTVGAAVMLFFGLLRGRSAAHGAVWAGALLVANAIVSTANVDYAVRRWMLIASLAGALAGLAEPPVRGRNRIVNALAWAAALPAAMFVAFFVAIFLDQPLDAIMTRGFLVGIFFGGAAGGVAAYLIGDKAAGLVLSARPAAGTPTDAAAGGR